MKKSVQFVILFSSICIVAVVTSCQRVPVVLTPQQQILGKWTMSTATTNTVFTVPTAGTNAKDTTRFTSADYFTFKADSIVVIMAGGVSHNGKWKIANNLLFFTGTNYVDLPTTGWAFPILTANHLGLSFSQVNSVSNTEFKLDFTR